MKGDEKSVSLRVPRGWRKQDTLEERLFALALERGAGEKMPKVRELCQTYGVSTSTLDPVLRSLELRGAIRREHGRGIFVSDGIRQKTVGVVFGGNIFAAPFSPFWSMLLQEAQKQVAEYGFRLQAYLDVSDAVAGDLGYHSQLMEDLDGRRLDGLLFFDAVPEAGPLFQTYGVPVVAFGGGIACQVRHDMHHVFHLAVKTLSKLCCRRIGLATEPEYHPVLRQELDKAGLGDVAFSDWSYQSWQQAAGGGVTREQCGRFMMQRMIEERAMNPLPDLVICTDDTATCGIVVALLQAGLRPGRDIQIISTCNRGSPVLDMYRLQMHLIEFVPAESVAAMLAMLDTIMSGGTPAGDPVLVRPHVVTE